MGRDLDIQVQKRMSLKISIQNNLSKINAQQNCPKLKTKNFKTSKRKKNLSCKGISISTVDFSRETLQARRMGC